jgi:uncharacterized small protein (DUF1192 family)
MDDDNPRPQTATLESLSIHELEARLVALESEKRLVQQWLDKKKTDLQQASSFFKSK